MTRKEIIAEINQILFSMGLDKQNTMKTSKLKKIIELVFQTGKYYVLADKSTTPAEWTRKQFDAYIEDRYLLVFLTAEDVKSYAMQNEFVSENNEPMYGAASQSPFLNLISLYKEQNSIDVLRIFTKLPLYVDCPVNMIPCEKEESVSQFMNHDYKQESSVELNERKSTELLLIPEVKQFLETNENKERRALDPSLAYANPHSMMEKVLYANKIDLYSLEDELELPSGFLTLYIKDKSSSSISKKIFLRLLRYFGLEPYAYQYAKFCDELRNELKANVTIDVCNVKPATVHTAEKFILESIRRGKTDDGLYVYGLKFRSKLRVVSFVVSSTVGYIANKEYEIFGLPTLDGSLPETKDESKEKAARTPDEILEDSVIAYFKKTNGDTVKLAREKYSKLAHHPDIQKEFAKFAQTGRPGRIKVREYSARKLVKELHFSPYEAYIELCLLRDKPSETLQFLKYRETDPQYQKVKNG